MTFLRPKRIDGDSGFVLIILTPVHKNLPCAKILLHFRSDGVGILGLQLFS